MSTAASEHYSAVEWTSAEVVKCYVNTSLLYLSFSCNRRFLNRLLKVTVAEYVMESGNEDHTFGRTNVREHCPENGLTHGKIRLEVDSLVA